MLNESGHSVSKSALAGYEHGLHTPHPIKQAAILRVLGAGPQAMPPQDDEAGDDDEERVTYPVAPNGHGADSTGRDNQTARPSTISLPPVLMRRLMGGRLPLDGLWSFASGTSMEPYIPNGFPIFIEPCGTALIDGERYAVWLGEADADVVKRIELVGGGAVALVADNPRVSNRTLWPTEDPEQWRTDDGGTIRLVIQGRVTFPPDTPASVVGGLESFARSIIEQIRKA